MDDQNGTALKTVLITGGSSGIGYALSQHFARDAYRILWVSQAAEELEAASIALKQAFPYVALHYLALDLAVPNAAQEVLAWTKKLRISVDVLVNNAGFGTYGHFEKMPLPRELAMLQLNAVTVYELTHLFLREMEAKGQGKIMNISSAASYVPMPYSSIYAGTKAFVRQMTESLAWELYNRRSPVKVCAVCPGPLADTKFQQQAGMMGVRTFKSIMASTTVDEVARDAYRGLQKNKTIIRTGLAFRINYWVAKFSPEWLARWIVLREMAKKE